MLIVLYIRRAFTCLRFVYYGAHNFLHVFSCCCSSTCTVEAASSEGFALYCFIRIVAASTINILARFKCGYNSRVATITKRLYIIIAFCYTYQSSYGTLLVCYSSVICLYLRADEARNLDLIYVYAWLISLKYLWHIIEPTLLSQYEK